ncbi:TPA: hypothetical protein ACKP0L_003549 [Pseudomonas putida]
MDTNKMREQFESWILENWPGQYLDRFETGEYHGFTLEHCWKAWQASREAVVVELPELRSVPDRDCWARTNGLGFNNALKEARQVIEAKGLKVAP